MILLILAVLWAGLIYSWFRERSTGHRVNSISSFNKHLSTLQRTSPLHQAEPEVRGFAAEPQLAPTRSLGVPALPTAYGPVNRRPIGMPLAVARRRRLNILVGLGGAAAITLLLALVTGGRTVLLVNLFLDTAVVVYVALLIRAQRIGAERRAKVRYLPSVAALSRQADRAPGFLLQRPAN